MVHQSTIIITRKGGDVWTTKRYQRKIYWCVLVIHGQCAANTTHMYEIKLLFVLWVFVRFINARLMHDDVIKWKHFPCCWPFVRGIYRSLVNYSHEGQCCGALMFSLICAWINGWVNNHTAGDLRRHRAHYDVTAMVHMFLFSILPCCGQVMV